MRGVDLETGASRTPFLEGFIINDSIILNTDNPFEGYVFAVIEFLQPAIPTNRTAHLLVGEPALGENKNRDLGRAFVGAMLKAPEDIIIGSGFGSRDLTPHAIPSALSESLPIFPMVLTLIDYSMTGFITDILGSPFIPAAPIVEIVLYV